VFNADIKWRRGGHSKVGWSVRAERNERHKEVSDVTDSLPEVPQMHPGLVYTAPLPHHPRGTGQVGTTDQCLARAFESRQQEIEVAATISFTESSCFDVCRVLVCMQLRLLQRVK